ncbi:MoaD/ThiS family protein [Nocardioides sp. STR2]|jgi:sulfur-carrier protein|uniref:MoaD/ThiS family protein n=1 Tax=Nocardioides pini TaxID=2975053 RepID=A0ABT4CFF6_9ACTN|nr:MoaD/ThiS family protein [Nocardioides pini]MCY4726582.1 MoaD/ThiS family protein [Nocardioides pini]
MSTSTDAERSRETAITVRYWAGARAAAGTAEDVLEATGELTLADVVARVLERHPGEQMARTVGVCSVLLGDQPVRTQDPDAVVVRPGDVVELLPPFAGG